MRIFFSSRFSSRTAQRGSALAAELAALAFILFAAAGMYVASTHGVKSNLPPLPKLDDIHFVLRDSYRPGEHIEVKITNTGHVPYYFNPAYEACALVVTELATDRNLMIPPGTHCDLVVLEEILPGETKKLFSWNLDECFEDNGGCVKSQLLAEGTYLIEGKFKAKNKSHMSVARGIVNIVAPLPQPEPTPSPSPTPTPRPSPPPQASECRADTDCKLIYSSCDCAAVSARDPRTELPSQIMCVVNSCTIQNANAACIKNLCARQFKNDQDVPVYP